METSTNANSPTAHGSRTRQLAGACESQEVGETLLSLASWSTTRARDILITSVALTYLALPKFYENWRGRRSRRSGYKNVCER